MTSISNFFESCFQDKKLNSLKSVQNRVVIATFDRLATRPLERINKDDIPGAIQQILFELGQADWDSVISDLYQEREQKIQKHEEQMDTLSS